MIRIGTSGWSYRHWEGVLYPHELPPRQRLDHYVARYHTVELNASYYRWPADSAFAYWRQRLPLGFVLAVKAPRGLTHQRRLYGPERWIERIRGGLAQLGRIRSILLVQLSPRFEIDLARLEYFLAQLPSGLRVAVEMRHPSWHQEAVFQLLERYDAAYCVMSGAGLPCVLRATSRVVYVRLHGPDGDATEADLQRACDTLGARAVARECDPEQLVRAFREVWDGRVDREHGDDPRSLLYYGTLSQCLDAYEACANAKYAQPRVPTSISASR
jgi:uncharacterized protein YecE (DUF72 family)